MGNNNQIRLFGGLNNRNKSGFTSFGNNSLANFFSSKNRGNEDDNLSQLILSEKMNNQSSIQSFPISMNSINISIYNNVNNQSSNNSEEVNLLNTNLS